ncbi:MAG: SPASM domain-containing protein, partial [Candidatus Marinimicrobia bacterium]|nr:SPASM domain-containing protein [Candidatus Neomarinimicrobiota bacterium]
AKKRNLPKQCQCCEFRFICNGGCPKNRFIRTNEGESGLNYLCKGYRHFFRHIDEAMRFMVNELNNERPPANVMKWIDQR